MSVSNKFCFANQIWYKVNPVVTYSCAAPVIQLGKDLFSCCQGLFAFEGLSSLGQGENALASIYDAYGAIKIFFPKPPERFGCLVPIKIKSTRQLWKLQLSNENKELFMHKGTCKYEPYVVSVGHPKVFLLYFSCIILVLYCISIVLFWFLLYYITETKV